MKINLIFRKPSRQFYSIERVFNSLFSFYSKKFYVRAVYAKSGRANLNGIIRNLIYCPKDADIYHITGDIHYAVLSYPSSRTILTIHDCRFMYSEIYIKRKIFEWWWLRIPISRAKFVTVISEKSKKEIIKFTGCRSEKILVIPNPVSPDFQFSSKVFNSVCPTILHVGTAPNKNLKRVILALVGLTCKLVIVGPLSESYITLLNQHAIDFLNIYNLSDEQMKEEYVKCDIVLFPSLFEGFGLPILEGQATGRVVITSDLEPMNDVAGGGSFLVNPFEVTSIRNAIDEAITNHTKREEIIRKGLNNVKKYNLETIAKKYYEVYNEVVRFSKRSYKTNNP